MRNLSAAFFTSSLMSQEGQKFPLRKAKSDPDELRFPQLDARKRVTTSETQLTFPWLLAAQIF